MTGNPIPFNPDMMPIAHAKDCVECLSHLFDQLDRSGITDEQIIHYMRQARDQQLRRWGTPK